MANLSNINNKFLVTTGGNILIGQTAAVGSSLLQVTGNSTFAGEIRTTNRLAIKETYFGYSSGYKVIQVGESAATKSISLGYDPSGNTSGSFSGNEILIPNNIRVLAPAANNSGYYGLIMLNSSNKVLLGSSDYLMESNYIMALDTATKNVGIGTDSPTSKLHLRDPGTNSDVGIKIGNDSRDWNLKVMGSVSDSLQFFTHDNSNVMTILPSGNVGIGTTNPLGKLDVYANSGTTTPGVGDGIYVGPSNAIVGMSMVYSNSGYTYSDFISRYNSSSSYMRFIMKGSATPVYAMTIRGDGDVGIGTAEPPSKLTVMESTLCTNSGTDGGTSYVPAKPILLVTTDGNGTASTNYATNSVFTVGIGGGITGNVTTEHFRVNLNGNVGIGVTPTQKLDVNGQMTHDGLVLKTGTSVYIDTIQTIDKTLSTTAGIWTNTGIEGTDIGANGSYMIQVYSNAHGTTGGAWYSMYWTGVMSWYKDASNGINASEIYLNFSGHALNSNVLQLRTVQHTSSGTPANLMSLEIKTSNTLTNAPISFRFRRLM